MGEMMVMVESMMRPTIRLLSRRLPEAMRKQQKEAHKLRHGKVEGRDEEAPVDQITVLGFRVHTSARTEHSHLEAGSFIVREQTYAAVTMTTRHT